jgi:Carboxypeptidase regulatory-like domain
MLRKLIFAFAVTSLLVVATGHAQTGLGTLSGYVLSSDGAKVPNARVYLQPGNGRAPHTMLTDKEGHYSFAKVRPGLYDVRAHVKDAWSEEHRNVVVKANKEMNLDLKIAPVVAKAAPGKPGQQD